MPVIFDHKTKIVLMDDNELKKEKQFYGPQFFSKSASFCDKYKSSSKNIFARFCRGRDKKTKG